MNTKNLGILDAVWLRNEGAYWSMRLNDKGKPHPIENRRVSIPIKRTSQKAKFFGSRYYLELLFIISINFCELLINGKMVF